MDNQQIHYKLYLQASKKAFKDYRKRLKIEAIKQIDLNTIEKLFVIASKDYQKSELSIEEFSDISGYLFNIDKINRLNLVNMNNKLNTAIVAGMELFWYSQQKDENSKKWYRQFQETVRNYLKYPKPRGVD